MDIKLERAIVLIDRFLGAYKRQKLPETDIRVMDARELKEILTDYYSGIDKPYNRYHKNESYPRVGL